MKNHSGLIFFLLSVIITIPAIIGLIHQGFPLTDDGNWMVIRFSAFYEALRNGQFPVRFLSGLNNGYGYPVADFLYPLFMYIGVPIHILRFSFVDTIKIIFAGSMLFSSIFCFLWLRKLFDNLSSLVGSAVYSLFPYHLWDIYKRGSVGEVLALAIVPFILWAVESENLLLTAIGYGLLIVSHNSLALLFLPVLFIYQLLRKKITKGAILNASLSLISGLLLSCFFWLPALYDKQFTVFDKTNVSDFVVYFISPSEYELFGIVFLLSLLASLFFIRKRDKRFIYFFAVNIISFLLTLPQSVIIWEKMPFVNLIQFPFRLISIIILGTSYLAAYKLSFFKGKIKLLVLIFYLIIIYVSAWKFLTPKSFQLYPDTFYSTNQDSTTVKNEYMPKWALEIPKTPVKEKAQILGEKGSIRDIISSADKINFVVFSSEKTTVQINQIYFPGWRVSVDNKNVPISYNNKNGLIRFDVLPGSHRVKAGFYETNLRIFSDFVSLFGVAVLALLFIKRKNFKTKI